jgi:NTE family protein
VSRIGLVLGAGGITGDAYHRGVLRAMHEAGYDARDAEIIVGTSAGAMVGAALRRPDNPPAVPFVGTVHGRRLGRGPDPTPLLMALARPWRARAGTVLTSLLPTGRRSTEFLVAQLRRQHGDRWPDRHLWICAVRRHDGRRVVFGRPGAPLTDVAHAVAASIAIPGYFHPVEILGQPYVDGGVHSPTNAGVLRGHGLDLVIISSPMSIDPRGLRATSDAPLRLYWHRVLRREIKALQRRGTAVVAIEPGGELVPIMGANPMRGGRVEQVEAGAAERAALVLADYLKGDAPAPFERVPGG